MDDSNCIIGRKGKTDFPSKVGNGTYDRLSSLENVTEALQIKDAIIKNLGELATKNEDQIFELYRNIQEKEAAIITLQENLSAIHNSWAWKAWSGFFQLVIRLLPPDSKRRKMARKIFSKSFISYLSKSL